VFTSKGNLLNNVNVYGLYTNARYDALHMIFGTHALQYETVYDYLFLNFTIFELAESVDFSNSLKVWIRLYTHTASR
jgi:hypothetical protein